ncbi:hypothetical protein BUL40_00800 [Croceivirga radicis]|uniref:DUF885 domain-containing protein n=1 Tax=Croceivirga radicis TaxID=1929488 RepID=A0A1V6LVB4_9FLAO|nr:hypothetical protein [Croceivirga radicis]OQD44124.1 hypothetical protein BUL40_00800 [Croceivirga radicis]
MKTTTILLPVLVMLLFTCTIDAKEKSKKTTPVQTTTNDYQDLVTLFKEWRRFETPPMHKGAPDYRKATFTERMPAFKQLRARHAAIDTTGWSIPNKVDWMVVWAEMNGFDFNHRVLKPWERDPAFYKTIWTAKSDVPAHEGPTHHGTLELWTYTFPLSDAARTKMLKELAVIPSLNAQAKTNLSGNARDLWVTGIRDIKTQSEVLENMKSAAGVRTDEALMAAIEKAQTATNQLVAWLEAQSDKKTGPSGIGKENYTWYMQNVHLVPLTWEDEVMILKRELARAWSALKLEEHRNRKLPQLIAADSPKSYDALANRAANSFLNFLEKEAILTVKDYFEPALREHLGTFVPEETRNFFYITSHYDPRPLFSHFYHWFELARMENEPNPSEIRKGPLLYNIFDSRNEGTATAVEEMFMDAGLYDDDPRVREIVYIMIAQRAARGLGSLYAHANEMTMEEAGSIHSEYTPRGWMKTEKELLIFEQHLYLRQPGYGTSYITGKYLLEAAMAAYARGKELEGAPFVLSDFFDSINSIGNIPVVLTQWEMTGNADHMVMMK